jgi:hypothetical protein
MEVTVEIVEDDIVHFNEHIRRRMPAMRRQFLYAWMIVCFLVFALASVVFAIEGRIEWLLTIPMALLVLSYPWLARTGLRRSIRRMLRAGDNQAIYGERRITLGREEIRFDSVHGYGGWYWSAVQAIDVDDRMLMIFTSSIQAVIVPRRAFADEVEFDSFVAAANRFWEDGR